MIRAWAIIPRVCSLEIKVHYLDITVFICCLLVGPSLTGARNQIQTAPAPLTISFYTVFLFVSNIEMRLNAVWEPTIQTRRSHLNLISSTALVRLELDLPKSSYKKERDDLSRTVPH